MDNEVRGERFHTDSDTGPVRREIAQSWRRSRLHGVDPCRFIPRWEEIATATPFTRIAVPILTGMAKLLYGTQTSLAVADPRGRILWRWVDDPGLRREMDKHSVDAGFDFNEQSVGTNGLGTSLETGRTVVVHGGEHFAESLRMFTCVAAPVQHPVHRRVVGAVNLTCRPEHFGPLLRPILARLVREVEHDLLEASSVEEKELLQGFLTETRSSRLPVVSISADVVIANRTATRLGIDHSLLWECARDAARHAVTEFTVPGSDELTASCRPVMRGDDLVGTVLVLHDRESADQHRPPMVYPNRVDPRTAIQRLVAAERMPLLRGEPGLGKTTLLSEVLANCTAAKVDVFDAALHRTHGTDRWLAELRDRLHRPDGAMIIRHLEALADTAPSVQALLDERDHRAPLVAATSTHPMSPCGQPYQPLLDLFCSLDVTPLRDRATEIPSLVERIIHDWEPKAGRYWFTPTALDLLQRHPWPGNLRQLRHAVETTLADSIGGAIGVAALPDEVRIAARQRHLPPLQQAEAAVIGRALDRFGGNKSAAARHLQISRTSLYQKIRSYGIDGP